jgi:hypothetical protein
MSEIYQTTDGTVVINESEASMENALNAVGDAWPELATLANWVQKITPPARKGSILHRDKYTARSKYLEELGVARSAATDDDIVSGALDLTEGLAFSRMKFKAQDLDEQDIWNQIGADLDLDSKFKEWWRELSTVSQVYTAKFWGVKTYKVRGTTDSGTRRKKSFRLLVPTALSVLDPTKIVPVGNLWFGQEDLAYAADRDEAEMIRKVLDGRASDSIVSQMIVSPYTPTKNERKELSEAGYPVDTLFLTSKAHVWRHTLTKPDYQRFPDVRLRSIFEILDMKHQLRAVDRTNLIGATHFLILVKKGSDQLPAQSSELISLANQMKTLAKTPVLVGDHRLSVEIVTPKQEFVLKPERWNALDARIASRVLRISFLGNFQCFDTRTRIMTRTGWRSHDEISVGDEILTLNIETGSSEWKPVSKMNVYDYDGPMVRMENRNHSSLTTPNHRWWVHNRTGNWKWETSATLTRQSHIPTMAPHSVDRISLLTLNHIKPVAAYGNPNNHSMILDRNFYYKGIVWCPTTPNETVLAERNGTVYWSGNSGTKQDDSIKLSKVMARQLESTRHGLRRSFEANFINPVFETNSNLTTIPKLRFFPKRVALDFDPILAQIISDLHARGDLSRETTLSEYDFSQEEEAALREREREEFDDIFNSGEPFNSPDNEPFNPQREGRGGGGNRNGGGTNPQSLLPPDQRS